MKLLKLLDGKDILVGAIDVANDKIETPEEVVAVIKEAMKYVAKEKIFPCTNCGLAPIPREIAYAKLEALGKGAALARKKFAKKTAKRAAKKSRPAGKKSGKKAAK